MKDLLAAQKASTFGQVSDNESSITESDCETLVASSDEETSCKHVVDKKNLITVRIRQGSGTSAISQQAINMQILSQLQVLGKRLEVMEQKSCKKNTDSLKIKSKSSQRKICWSGSGCTYP